MTNYTRRWLDVALILLLWMPASAARTFALPQPQVSGEWTDLPPLAIGNPWDEIVNAAILPRLAPGVPSPRTEGKLLLWCARSFQQMCGTPPLCDPASGSGPAQAQGQTFLWDDIQGVFATYTVPNNCTTDLFCSGLAFDRFGALYVFGGQDYQTCNKNGHNAVFQFPNVPFSQLGWAPVPVMERRRWYPTPLILSNGFFYVAGHDGAPPGTGTPTTDTHEVFDPISGNWLFNNVAIDNLEQGMPPCNSTSTVEIIGYPRFHVLLTGELFLSGYSEETRILEDHGCPGLEPVRWGPPLVTQFGHDRHDGNALQFITLVNESDPNTYKETIYIMGGGLDLQNPTQCLSPASFDVTNKVERIVNPSSGASWDDVGVADLQVGRRGSNAVILADGSIVVIGGETYDSVLATCVGERTPERFEPPEVFDPLNPNPGPGSWANLQDQPRDHTYHSVAGLLADGRVFAGGGQPAASSGHRLEIFRPPYLYSGPRPSIDAAPDTIPYYSTVGTTFAVAVRLWGGGGIGRMHLLRPTAVTHHADANLRYVQLFIETIVVNGEQDPPVATMGVRGPLDGNMAPPGWYWLFVVDTAGVPSVGHWVRIPS